MGESGYRDFAWARPARGLTPGAISKACQMSWCLIVADERGEGAVVQHLWRGNIMPSRRAERRR